MADKFTKVREAYEVLSDPAERARYDRRGERRASPFYGNMWNRGTVNAGAPPPAPAGSGPKKGGRAGNDLDLEDIFNDFGVGDFGFTGQTRGQPGAPSGGARPKQGPAPETGRFTGRSTGSARAGTSGTGTSGSGTSGSGTSAGGTSGGGAASGGRARGGDTSGFGFGGVRVDGAQMGGGGTRSSPSGSAGAPGAGGSAREATGRPRRPGPQPGRDLTVAVDVPPEIAARGGTVTVTYPRLRRADDGHTLYRYDELHDLKVPPGIRHGDTLRVTGMGDAGLEGGRYGELVVDVRVVGGRAQATDERGAAWDPEMEGGSEERGEYRGGAVGGGGGGADPGAGRRDAGRMKMPSRDEPADGVLRVDIGVVEALLGGRVLVETPGGAVRVNIPAGTSSGTRMRLRGRGAVGADGVATDLVAEVRIVVPKVLDEESRRLIERFGELNRRG